MQAYNLHLTALVLAMERYMLVGVSKMELSMMRIGTLVYGKKTLQLQLDFNKGRLTRFMK